MVGESPPGRFARHGIDLAVLAVLYAGALAVNLVSVHALSSGMVLMGEEMSVSIRDVLFTVEQHAQASIWSTNVGAPAYYWLASHLDPGWPSCTWRRPRAGGGGWLRCSAASR